MLLLLSVCQVKTGHYMHHQTLIDDHCLVGELGVNLNYGGRLTSNTNLRKMQQSQGDLELQTKNDIAYMKTVGCP